MPKDDLFLLHPRVAAFEVMALESDDMARLAIRCRLCAHSISWEGGGWIEKPITELLQEMSKHECEAYNTEGI